MRRYFVICGAIIGWALGVLLPQYGRWPQLWLDPQTRRVFVARAAGALPIGYYGLILWGILGASVGAACGFALARKGKNESFGLAAAWALTAILVAAAYYTFQLWPQIGQ
jgi:hypothetical protein